MQHYTGRLWSGFFWEGCFVVCLAPIEWASAFAAIAVVFFILGMWVYYERLD